MRLLLTVATVPGGRATGADSRHEEEVMYWYDSPYLGMHFFWWVFWAMLIVALFSWGTPVPRKMVHLYRETPLGILQKRNAAGEITTEEYDLRKERIVRDSNDPKLRSFRRRTSIATPRRDRSLSAPAADLGRHVRHT